ncbi:MAG: hypothetical protein KY442_13740, partial [Proteobacteria bacterium]|nr:hypothetical protein [Pseudomonadota bacterium]
MSLPPLAPPAALAAFLRGVERRGAVLAQLQCGDAGIGDAALAAAMRDFGAAAAGQPMAEWPRRFWMLLLAEPGLCERPPVTLPLDATDRLAALASGPRAALLLRLAAGLTEADAAAVLGIPTPSYRLALHGALPRDPDGRPNPQAWQRLREQVQRRIKALPPARLERLMHAREAVLAGAHGATVAAPAPAGARAAPTWHRPRHLLALLWTLLALSALALAATFWWPYGAWPLAGLHAPLDRQAIQVRPLPPGAAPASRLGADAGLIAHRDFELLADPGGAAAAR